MFILLENLEDREKIFPKLLKPGRIDTSKKK